MFCHFLSIPLKVPLVRLNSSQYVAIRLASLAAKKYMFSIPKAFSATAISKPLVVEMG